MIKVKNRTKQKIEFDQKCSGEIVAKDESLWSDPFIHVLLVVIIGSAVYFNTLWIPFFFDDYICIVKNPLIRSIDFFLDSNRIASIWIPFNIKNDFIMRPVVYFSFFLNYAIGGLDVRGYHLVNLIVHIANSLLVYLFFYLTLKTAALKFGENSADNDFSAKFIYLPFFAALLFVCHPIQTMAISYIVQRTVPLMSFFYLGSLVLYIISRQGKKVVGNFSYLIALIFCVLAMQSKENAITLPVVICLYEFIFYYGDLKSRFLRMFPFLAALAIIPLKLMLLDDLIVSEDTNSIIDTAKLVNVKNTSPIDYLMSQFGVIVTYIRLLLIPINQNFDYDLKLQKTFLTSGVIVPLFILMIIAGTGVWFLLRSKKIKSSQSCLYAISAFGIFWFFITLSVESSLFPLDDLLFEYRVYLPSVGYFMAILAGTSAVFAEKSNGRSLVSSKAVTGILIILVFAYSVAGYKRNMLWINKAVFWKDVAAKSPNKPRVQVNLGIALMEQMAIKTNNLDDDNDDSKNDVDHAGVREMSEAISAFERAIKLRPKYALAHFNLGKAFEQNKQYDEAVREYLTAASLSPTRAMPYIALGYMYKKRGDWFDARRSFLKAVQIAPLAWNAHLSLAESYEDKKEYSKALKEMELTYKLFPDVSVKSNIDRLKQKLIDSDGVR